MIDIKTGRFSWAEGKVLFPGMTYADFEQTVLYQNELLKDRYKTDRRNVSCRLRTQVIDGFPMAMKLVFDHHDFLAEIYMSHPDFYRWPDWPKEYSEEAYHLLIKDHNDRFLATQFQSQIEGGRELSFMFDWGKISSSFSYVHDPDAIVTLEYFTFRFDPTFVQDNRPLYEIMGWTEDKDGPDIDPWADEEETEDDPK